jgi:hypothetical protein
MTSEKVTLEQTKNNLAHTRAQRRAHLKAQNDRMHKP